MINTATDSIRGSDYFATRCTDFDRRLVQGIRRSGTQSVITEGGRGMLPQKQGKRMVPSLLEKLAIKGCLVTADAMSCQKTSARQIVKQEADYLLAVKKNQRNLYQAIDAHFISYWEQHPTDSPNDSTFSATSDAKHSRREYRRCWTHEASEWSILKTWGAKTVAAIQYDRATESKKTSDIRYFISSREMSAEEVLLASRQHWQVENNLHWVLDVAFNEDQSRARQGFAAKNLATARQIALNLLKQDTSIKAGIKNKRRNCGWDENFLCHILGMVI